MNKITIAILTAMALLLSLHSAEAGSATWNLDPVTGDWDTAANWTPATVPNGPSDTATFAVSNVTEISVSHNTLVNSVVFGPDATAFTITVPPTFHLTLNGMGAINDSGNTQNFAAAADPAGNRGYITFSPSATAGAGLVFTNLAG